MNNYLALKKSFSLIVLFTCLIAGNLPDGFAYVSDSIPNIELDMRYCTNFNFLGTPVDGYQAPVAILSEPAVRALMMIQQELNAFGMGLKIYDAYRPQKAVDHFVRWAADYGDTLTKKEFYPTLAKPVLLEEVYIATRSSHSRGSAVDVTIITRPPRPQPPFDLSDQCDCSLEYRAGERDNSIDMGSGFDCFHEVSHTAYPGLTPRQRSNRLLLKSIMEKYGFKNYSKEWWHFNYVDEPFPESYFNFDVR